jgi:hypothetical protein
MSSSSTGVIGSKETVHAHTAFAAISGEEAAESQPKSLLFRGNLAR